MSLTSNISALTGSKVGTVLKSWGPVDFKTVLGDLQMLGLRWDISINDTGQFLLGHPVVVNI